MKSIYKIFCFIEAILIVLWGIFFYGYYIFLNDALIYGKDEASLVIKFVMILSYREKETILYIVLAFLLLTLNCFFVHLVYFKHYNSSVIDIKTKQLLRIAFTQLIISLLLLNTNVLFIVMLPVSIFSGVIVYLIYLIFKIKYGDLLTLREKIVGLHGPFQTKEERDIYLTSLNNAYSLSSLEKEEFIKNNQFFIEFKEIKIDR